MAVNIESSATQVNPPAAKFALRDPTPLTYATAISRAAKSTFASLSSLFSNWIGTPFYNRVIVPISTYFSKSKKTDASTQPVVTEGKSAPQEGIPARISNFFKSRFPSRKKADAVPTEVKPAAPRKNIFARMWDAYKARRNAPTLASVHAAMVKEGKLPDGEKTVEVPIIEEETAVIVTPADVKDAAATTKVNNVIPEMANRFPRFSKLYARFISSKEKDVDGSIFSQDELAIRDSFSGDAPSSTGKKEVRFLDKAIVIPSAVKADGSNDRVEELD